MPKKRVLKVSILPLNNILVKTECRRAIHIKVLSKVDEYVQITHNRPHPHTQIIIVIIAAMPTTITVTTINNHNTNIAHRTEITTKNINKKPRKLMLASRVTDQVRMESPHNLKKHLLQYSDIPVLEEDENI
jgi:hypothetical protein